MRLANLFSLAVFDLRAARARSLVSVLGIALGVAVLLVVVGLGLGARELVRTQLARELPLDFIEVTPKTVDLGLFKVPAGSLLGGAALDEATLMRLTKIPRVAAAYPKLEVSLPLGAEGGMYLFKRRLRTDLFMTGLPEELLRAEVGEGFRDERGFVPVVVSDQLLEIYNTAVAGTIGGPKLTSKTLKGFEFDLVIGRSFMLGMRGARRAGTERARVVGVSRYAMRLGVSVPLATARRLLADYGDGAPETYTSIFLELDSPAAAGEVTRAVLAAGLMVEDSARRAAELMTAATLIASLVGLLVLALAGLNIAHSFFAVLAERRRELAIMRAVGARRGDLLLVVLMQATLLGLFGAVLGGAAGRLSAALLDLAARVFLPEFPFKPESFFVMPVSLFLAAAGAAILAALLGAFWPAVRASRASVARTLAEG